MRAPQIIRTEAGEELVVLTRNDYDAMIARLDDIAEDEADAATYVAAKAAMGQPSQALASATAEQIRGIRRARGMTQLDLAKAAGVTQGYLSEIEAGKKRAAPEVLEDIAKALGVAVDRIGGGYRSGG